MGENEREKKVRVKTQRILAFKREHSQVWWQRLAISGLGRQKPGGFNLDHIGSLSPAWILFQEGWGEKGEKKQCSVNKTGLVSHF